ncbi:hypothetical protein FACS1894133_1590 [Clostridia bacterium]|nr:hypothetical protein FACS1894133_1590 [Clostridia bacterium]
MAGAERFRYRDPVQHIAEAFCTQFENSGRAKAEKFGEDDIAHNAAGNKGGIENGIGGGSAENAENTDRTYGGYAQEAQNEQDGGKAASPGADGLFFKGFSDTAFRNGKLFGAVQSGNGRLMLTSCLNRAICPSESVRQRKLFKGSKERNIDGSFGDKVLLNKGVADSAVGITASALKDSRRVVDSFIKVAGGKIHDTSGSETMRKMFPFLATQYDKECLAKYNADLKDIDGDSADSLEKRDIIRRAVAKTTAVIEKKELMRVHLIDSLREISENAGRVIEELEQSRNTDKDDVNKAVADKAESGDIPPEDLANILDGVDVDGGYDKPGQETLLADSLDFVNDNSFDGYDENVVDTVAPPLAGFEAGFEGDTN